ncbi:CIC11C00000002693 [Sungouiella intermedia]|uniref:CIC11C00000002693 n=1 Tax=Sungouiella intermedia TaxID=45354 RepID=A0A1L0BL73_9ASCO|nr:CIC11C00000002693 [[Candida] intermedia]
MAKSLDSPSNEAAYNYAFALAMTAHLAEVEAKFLALPAEDFQSLEQTLWAQDMTTNFHLVREFGLRRLADYYRKDDLALNCPQGQYRHSLSYAMESQLLGPRVKVLNTITTEQILAKVDEPAQFTGVLLFVNQLRKKLYLILINATKVVVGSNVGDTQMFHSISQVLAEYLTHMASSLTEQLDIGALSMQIDSTVSHLRLEASGTSCDFHTLFRVFRAMLASQLQVSSANVDEQESTADVVCQLREQGNNLMHISSYPQAIKVYTEAISLCDWTCSNNVPQLYTNRAIAFIGLNCFPEAVSDLNAALRYDRTFTPAWAQLGYCQLNLGSGFLALQCFHTALRTVAGEIYPENFPEDQDLRAKFTENKMRTVVPQFVQKLVQSIILSDKRASQQLQSTESIREITARTRAILARLRATVSPEDLNYLSYSLDTSFDTFRTAASRANRTRPSILTPDVVQDIMAGNNMEATAVTILSPITFTPPTLRRNNGTNPSAASGTDDGPVPPTPGADTPSENRATDTTATFNFGEDGIRNMLNNLGEALGDMVHTQTQEFFSQANQEAQPTADASVRTPVPAPAPPVVSAAAELARAAAQASASSTTAVTPSSGSSTSISPDSQTQVGEEARAAENESETGAQTARAATSQPTNSSTFIRTVVQEPEAGNSQTAADFRNSIQNFLPDIRGNLGGIISLALRHHLDATRNQARRANNTTQAPSHPTPSVVRIHQRPLVSRQLTNPRATHSSDRVAVTQTTAPQTATPASQSSTPQADANDDAEMPDAPDLD